jgi:hypothetical protein
MPPGPLSVTSRDCPSARFADEISARRPTNSLNSMCRLPRRFADFVLTISSRHVRLYRGRTRLADHWWLIYIIATHLAATRHLDRAPWSILHSAARRQRRPHVPPLQQAPPSVKKAPNVGGSNPDLVSPRTCSAKGNHSYVCSRTRPARQARRPSRWLRRGALADFWLRSCCDVQSRTGTEPRSPWKKVAVSAISRSGRSKRPHLERTRGHRPATSDRDRRPAGTARQSQG